MTEGTDKLSIIKRQDAFLDEWVAAEGIDFSSNEQRAAYQERAGLVAAAIRIDPAIQRVPVMPLGVFAPTMLAGLSGHQAMYDPAAAGQANLDYCMTYQPVNRFNSATGELIVGREVNES